MFPIKIGLNATSVLYTGSHNSFPIVWGEECLKRILTYLYDTKYNENNKGH